MSTHNSGARQNEISQQASAGQDQNIYLMAMLSEALPIGVVSDLSQIANSGGGVAVNDANFTVSASGLYKIDFELEGHPALVSDLVTVANGGRPGNGFRLQIAVNGAVVGFPVARSNVAVYESSNAYAFMPSLKTFAVVALQADDIINFQASQDFFANGVGVIGQASIVKIAELSN